MSDIHPSDLDDPKSWLLSLPRLVVYVGCSITSHECKDLKDQLLTIVEQVFPAFHVVVYNPARHTNVNSPHYANEVYAIDHLQAMRCDLIFFVRVSPSHGMGMEAQIAADLIVPWSDAMLVDNQYQLTPLVGGLANPSAKCRINFDTADLTAFEQKLRSSLRNQDVLKFALEFRDDRLRAKGVIVGARIGFMIRRQRLLLNMPVEHLAQQVDMEPWWIESIERDPELAPGLTLIQLTRLIHAARLRFATNPKDIRGLELPQLVRLDKFSLPLVEAATEFAEYTLRIRSPGEPLPENDDSMLRHWREWLSEHHDLSVSNMLASYAPRISQLTAYFSPPMSNVNGPEQCLCVDGLSQEIVNAATQFYGIPIRVYDPRADYQKPPRDDFGIQIYMTQVRQLVNADLGIVLLTPAATGVGIMGQLMANATMPVLCIAAENFKISRMFTGLFVTRVGEVVRYSPTTNLPSLIQTVLCENVNHLMESAARRRQVRDALMCCSFKRVVERFRIVRGETRESVIKWFVRASRLREEWSRALAEEPSVTPVVTLLQFVHMADKLNCRIGVTESGVITLYPKTDVFDRPFNLTPTQIGEMDHSLDNLLDAKEDTHGTLYQPDDEVVFEAWKTYTHEVTMDSAKKIARVTLLRSKADWSSVLFGSREL